MPVQSDGEKPSRSSIKMLYCDASGKVYTTTLSRKVYQSAREIADKMESAHQSYAIVGRGTEKGDFIPEAVEMEYILEHALKKGTIPDILKKYIKPIIKRGQAERESPSDE